MNPQSVDCDLVPSSLVHHPSLALRMQYLFVSTSLRVSIIDLDVSLSTRVTYVIHNPFVSPVLIFCWI